MSVSAGVAQPGLRLIHPRSSPWLGKFAVPGDKSLSHRALILAAMARGVSRLQGLLDSADVQNTARLLRQLGARLEGEWGDLRVTGWGTHRCPGPLALDCGNSGTTMRLMAGVLAAGRGEYSLHGDASLNARPMRRVAAPLRELGASVETAERGTAPLRIVSRPLQGVTCSLEVPSAQVKSCLLLAGVQAQGETVISGDRGSRDHTERMMRALGVNLRECAGNLAVQGGQTWPGFAMRVPRDPSSAAFPVTLAVLVPGSAIEVPDLGLNPTRLGFYRLLQRMGARVSWQVQGEELGEPWGTLRAEYSGLQAIDVAPRDIPSSIDELPLLAVAAAAAHGTTRVVGAGELRHKESDRLSAIARELGKMGVDIRLNGDGWIIAGPTVWSDATVSTWGDHRLEMCLAVAASLGECGRQTRLEGCGNQGVSWPDFWESMFGGKP